VTTKLKDDEVVDWTTKLLEFRKAEEPRLERIYQYLRDPNAEDARRTTGTLANGPLRWLNSNVPQDVKRLAEMARVNMLKFVVNATTQVMYADGFRAPKSEDEQPAWETWQLNRMDARQIGVHRSALSYGVSYVIVLPGDPVAVIRGASARKLTAVYGDDDDWPELALEDRRSIHKGKKLFRVYDAMKTFLVEKSENGQCEMVKPEEHGVGHCPIVRFRATIDDDEDAYVGEVEPLIPLQDQINVTTFGLLVAQHYGAFRQRYIMGWTADTETAVLQASAKKLWAFEDPNVTVGEFQQTDLGGFIESREASLRHLATISQTPAHELLGQLVNLSAEALAAAEANHRRKVLERQTSFGESWEQVLELSAKIGNQASDPMAQVRWRDTEARSLSQMVDALGKLVTMLGVPPQELWERVPGVSQADVDRWKAAASTADAIGQLNEILARQSQPGNADGNPMNGNPQLARIG
jgi:hypothetical protein